MVIVIYSLFALQFGNFLSELSDLFLEVFDISRERLLVDQGLYLDHFGPVGEVQSRQRLLETENRS